MQVCGLGLLMAWTKECELGIAEIRNDRKAIPNTSKKFSTTMGRLSTILSKGSWKNVDEHVTPLQRLRLESMIAVSMRTECVVFVNETELKAQLLQVIFSSSLSFVSEI